MHCKTDFSDGRSTFPISKPLTSVVVHYQSAFSDFGKYMLQFTIQLEMTQPATKLTCVKLDFAFREV